MNTREIYDAMIAQGWTTGAIKPVGVIAATLIQLEKNGVAERVGEAWRLRNAQLGDAFAAAIVRATELSQPA
jgi:hypothetical protein